MYLGKLLLAVLCLHCMTVCSAGDPTPTVDRADIPTGHWNITNAKNQSCMIFHMGIRVNVHYRKSEDGDTHIYSSNVPANATARGKCPLKMVSKFSLEWTDEGNHFHLYFNFHLIPAKPPKPVDWWNTTSVDLDYDLSGLLFARPSGRQYTTVNSTELKDFKALSHQSLICGTGYKLELEDDKGTVDIVNVRIQPFDVVGNKLSFKTWYCEHDSPFAPRKDNTGPIVVGSLITASFLIALLSYVFARQRVRSGYQAI